MATDIVLQSRVDFSHKCDFKVLADAPVGVDGGAFTMEIPSRWKAPKNIVITTQERLERLKLDWAEFKHWFDSGKIVVLPTVPSNFYDASTLAAQAKQETIEVKTELKNTADLLSAKEAENALLKKQLAELGGAITPPSA